MANSIKQVKGLDGLEKEIRMLKKKAKLLEQEIDNHFTYLHEHAGSLLMNSLLPRKTEEEMQAAGFSFGGNILYALLQNERLRKNLGRLASRFGHRLGEWLNKLIHKFS